MKKLLLLLFLSISTLNYAKNPTLDTLKLNSLQQESLMKLASLYSYARYFSPNPQIEEVDWYAYLEQNIKVLLKEKQAEKIDSLLLHQYQLFLPQLSFSQQALPTPKTTTQHLIPFYIKSNKIIPGYSKKNINSQLEQITTANRALPLPDKQYSFPLSNTLFANYAIAVTQLPPESNALKQLISDTKKKWKKDFYTSPYYRLTNAIIIDAYIQHFYAYYKEDQLDKTWHESCKNYLREIALSSIYKDYLWASYKHYAAVKDDHLMVMNGYSKPGALFGRYLTIYYPDIVVRLIEGKLCIAADSQEYPTLKAGDEIIRIEGKNSQEIIQERLKYSPGATFASRYTKMCNFYLFPSIKKKSNIPLAVKHLNGNIEKIQLHPQYSSPKSLPQAKFITQVEPGIWKINLCCEKEACYKAFKKHITDFQQAKGLIFDIRGYPDPYSTLPILSHFIDKAAWVGQIQTPTYYYPNHENVSYAITENGKWGIHPATEKWQKIWEYERPLPIRIKTPVVFLSNEEALSFSETMLELIKHYKIGTIIGSPSAGTNGDAVICKSPSMGIIFTGHKFLSHTGKRLHGIGIQPDIFCPTTRKDLAEHRDTQVKKACEVIKKK